MIYTTLRHPSAFLVWSASLSNSNQTPPAGNEYRIGIYNINGLLQCQFSSLCVSGQPQGSTFLSGSSSSSVLTTRSSCLVLPSFGIEIICCVNNLWRQPIRLPPSHSLLLFSSGPELNCFGNMCHKTFQIGKVDLVTQGAAGCELGGWENRPPESWSALWQNP